MSIAPLVTEHDLVQSVAKQYQADGYRVVVEPSREQLPFDLGQYRPDLIVEKDNSDSALVEVKSAGQHVSYEALQPVIEETKRHKGWRFVLVNGQDMQLSDFERLSGEFSWSEIQEGLESSSRLKTFGSLDAAYLVLWIAFERCLRKLAVEASLPLGQLAPSSVIRRLYSQGELTMNEFEIALQCLEVRNRLVHGFRLDNTEEAYIALRKLLEGLLFESQRSQGQS